MTWGADAIYDIVDGKLEFRGYFKMPAAQGEEENCVAHNGSIVPVPGRDIFVQAWYQGGVSIFDFTDSAAPVEIAYFDRGPLDSEPGTFGGYWSTYWYDGRIYGTETMRGLDVLALVPSEHLSANEIAAAALGDEGETFNPQQQFRVHWPAEPVVARAYIDQLDRDNALDKSQSAELNALLADSEAALQKGGKDRKLASRLRSMADAVAPAAAGTVTDRRKGALAGTLRDIAERLG